jgi:hypothetical protein
MKEDAGNFQPYKNPLMRVRKLPSCPRVREMTNLAVDEKIKKAGLLHMSGDDFMSPELIDDAIDGTIDVHHNIDLSDLMNQIKGDFSAAGESR